MIVARNKRMKTGIRRTAKNLLTKKSKERSSSVVADQPTERV
jgi:hypothetical protein